LSPHTGIWSASQDIPKQSNSGSIASVVVATASSPATVGAQLVFNGMPSRYIIIILNFAYSVDVVPTFSASESYIVQKVFVRLLVENQVHLASIRDSAELRPLPWPSFSSYAVSVHLTVPWSPRVWACSSALMISSPALFGALLVAQSVTVDSRGELMVLAIGFLTTSKEVQCNTNCLSWTYSLSHEPFGVSMLINMAAQGSTRDSLLACGLGKSRIVWDPGAQLMSFLLSHSVDAFKICDSPALQMGWQLRNANCSNHNLWCTVSSSIRQHQHGVWLSACRVQVCPLQSLLVETSANSKTSAVIYEDLVGTQFDISGCLWQASDSYFFTEDQINCNNNTPSAMATSCDTSCSH
jgi:hypothetical protein